tara:strand:- start:462 stop:755 length:294 start_codon:yes stop_codon:yes gene_type:complete
MKEMILFHDETGSAYKLVNDTLFAASLKVNGEIDHKSWCEVDIGVIATNPIYQVIHEKLQNWEWDDFMKKSLPIVKRKSKPYYEMHLDLDDFPELKY